MGPAIVGSKIEIEARAEHPGCFLPGPRRRYPLRINGRMQRKSDCPLSGERRAALSNPLSLISMWS
jgi:hypothetical protein